ncbi:MAG: PIN domain-containing protein [Methylococcaceae bacterium]
MKRILIDSGPIIALFDSSDKYHKISRDFIKNNSHELITSLASITEAQHLLDFNRNAQTDCLSWVISGAVSVEDINQEDLIRVKELIIKYADMPMDFSDACLVRLGEKYNIDEVATIDSDFDVYRLNKTKSFRTVLK